MHTLAWYTLAFLPIAVAGCGGSTPVAFSKVKSDVLTPSCVFSTCHDPMTKAGGLDLKTDPYAALVNKPATWPAAKSQGLLLVVPDDTSKSFLYEKLTLGTVADPTWGQRMPNTGTAIDPTQLTDVEGWINGGAKND